MERRLLQGVLGSSSASLSVAEDSLSLEDDSLPEGLKSLSSAEKSDPELSWTSLAISGIAMEHVAVIHLQDEISVLLT